MDHTDQPSWDLIQQPWLLCRDLDGGVQELGILRTLASAHQLAGLSGDVPTQVFALTRLLLAVLHGALRGPRDVDDWAELWKADELPVPRIAEYLEKHRARFDLFHPETPFLQVADLHTAKGETSALSKLVADVPNGVPFFTTRSGTDLSLSYAEAARWVAHCQAFDPSGIKTGAVGDERVTGGRGYPIGVAWSGLLGGVLLEGRTLKETLLLNLVARDFDDYARDPVVDLPAWERPPVTAAEEQPGGRPPTGPVDLYTWQSRRIRLIASGERVTSVLIANGERLTPQNRQRDEPHTAWRRSEAQQKKSGSSNPVYMPREHDPDRAIWRGLESLLPAASSRQQGDGGRFVSPGILEWLAFLLLNDEIEPAYPFRVRAIGMIYGSNSSVTADIVHDSLALRAVLARREAGPLVGAVTSCVQAAELAARAVGGLAGDLADAAGGDGTGPRSRTIERAYAVLDAPFREWLFTLGPETDSLAAEIDWHRRALAVVRSTAGELLRDIPPACWAGRQVRQRLLTAAHAEKRYWDNVRAALPYAFAAEPVAAP